MLSSTALVGYVIAALFVLLGVALEIAARCSGFRPGLGRYAFALAAVITFTVIGFSLLITSFPR